jgi:hypothetical protein
MAQDPISLLKLVTHYTEMPEADQAFAIESATNALRIQEKSETTMYFKDLAELVKKDFDTAKGYVDVLCHEFSTAQHRVNIS